MAKTIRESQTIKLQGKEYFQVAGRIIEFRRDNPTWSILTEAKLIGEAMHMFAVIQDETGRILATSHKRIREGGKGPAAQFPVETAETGAIGRALGLMGYGTLGGDFEEHGQIADAPVANPWK